MQQLWGMKLDRQLGRNIEICYRNRIIGGIRSVTGGTNKGAKKHLSVEDVFLWISQEADWKTSDFYEQGLCITDGGQRSA